MTAVIRYVTNTIQGGTTSSVESSKVDSTGSDYQLVAFSIGLQNNITNNSDIDIVFPLLTWTGAGTIKEVMNIDIDTTSMDIYTETHLDIVINGNTIECVLPKEKSISSTASIRMLVVIGNY